MAKDEALCGPTIHGFDCVLPQGHNMGAADVPWHHRSASAQEIFSLILFTLRDRYHDLVAVPYENIAGELAHVLVTNFEMTERKDK